MIDVLITKKMGFSFDETIFWIVKLIILILDTDTYAQNLFLAS